MRTYNRIQQPFPLHPWLVVRWTKWLKHEGTFRRHQRHPQLPDVARSAWESPANPNVSTFTPPSLSESLTCCSKSQARCSPPRVSPSRSPRSRAPSRRRPGGRTGAPRRRQVSLCFIDSSSAMAPVLLPEAPTSRPRSEGCRTGQRLFMGQVTGSWGV